MRRSFLRLVLVGAILVVVAVLWQVFAIAAYFRSSDSFWLDAHGAGSLFVHLGQLAVVIGAIVAAWGTRGGRRACSGSGRPPALPEVPDDLDQ